MDQSKAIILTYTPQPERICAAAARISTTLGTATEIYARTRRDNIGNLISNVLGIGHKTIIEHAAFTIAFENVSAFFEQFLIEFRLAAFTIKSRRYVDFSRMGFYHPEFRFRDEVPEIEKKEIHAAYRRHIESLFEDYTALVEKGIPKEDARFILPYCYRSNIYCSINARELLHVIYAAVHGRGKRFPEISALGEQLLRQAQKILPDVFSMLERIESGSEDKELKLRALLKGRIRSAKAPSDLTELVAYPPHSDKIVAQAAITGHTGCDSAAACELIENKPEVLTAVLDIVTRDRRPRELEQVNFTFRINGLSLAGLTHLARHRIQSLLVPSFTEFGKSADYIIPDTIEADSKLLARYHAVWKRNRDFFERLSAAGVAREDLVYLYLSGNLLDVTTTMNGRELYHFTRLRTCNRAQWEIRRIAIDMLKKLRAVAPKLFVNVGPSCFMDGKCPEGTLSCGQSRAVKAFFEENASIWKE